MAFKFDHYSEEVFNAIRRFLDKKHLHYTASEIMGLIQLDLPTGSMIRRVDLRINVKNDSYTVRALSSVSADPKDAKSMASWPSSAMWTATAVFLCRRPLTTASSARLPCSTSTAMASCR